LDVVQIHSMDTNRKMHNLTKQLLVSARKSTNDSNSFVISSASFQKTNKQTNIISTHFNVESYLTTDFVDINRQRNHFWKSNINKIFSFFFCINLRKSQFLMVTNLQWFSNRTFSMICLSALILNFFWWQSSNAFCKIQS